MKEAPAHEKPPPSPTRDDIAGDDDKPRGSYALADMDKATFDEVSASEDSTESSLY